MSASCERCGLPATYPGAAVDASGQCALCRAAGDRTWPSAGEEALRRLLDPAVADERAPYVGLVSYSGGKDSTYMLARLAALYPGRLLAFTYDTGTMSPGVWANIERVVGRLGVGWLRFAPPSDLMKRVFRGALETLIPLQKKKTIYARGTVEFGPLCYACGTLYNLMAIHTAAVHRIPFVVTGFTPAQDSTHYPLAHRFVSKPSELHAGVHEGRVAGLPARDYVRMAEPMLRLLEGVTSELEMLPFRGPSSAAEGLERLRVLRFYDYVPYDENRGPARSDRGRLRAAAGYRVRFDELPAEPADPPRLRVGLRRRQVPGSGRGARPLGVWQAERRPPARDGASDRGRGRAAGREYRNDAGGAPGAPRRRRRRGRRDAEGWTGGEMTDHETNQDPAEVVRRFLAQEFPNAKTAIETMSLDQSLIELGVLDSLSLLMIVMFLETTWGFKVPPPDFVPEQFETLARIRTFVEARRASGGASAAR